MPPEIFTLKFLSPATGCSSHEMRFETEPAAIAAILDTDIAGLTTHQFYLDEVELAALDSVTDLLLPDWDGEVMLTRPHRIDQAPYLVHTNFELPLMLDGRKPFAILDGEEGFDGFEAMRGLFRPHVENGSILERVRKTRGEGPTFLIIYTPCLARNGGSTPTMS